MKRHRPVVPRVKAGLSTLEVCIAAGLFGLTASATLLAATAAQRDATLAALRQTALALAEERLETLGVSGGPDEAAWQARVTALLPGGSGNSVPAAGTAVIVQVRWRAPGVADTRCPGLACVTLRSGP